MIKIPSIRERRTHALRLLFPTLGNRPSFIACLGLVLIVLLFSFGLSLADERVSVGACPLVIDLHLGGEWKKAQRDPLRLEALSANKNRKTVYAAVYSLLDDPISRSFVAIGSLGSLEKHQGYLGQAQFDALANRFVGLKKKIPSEARDYIRNLERGSGIDISITKLNIVEVERRGNSISLYGFTKAIVDNREIILVTVQRTTLLRGCIITLQFGFPFAAYSFRDIQRMVWNVGLR